MSSEILLGARDPHQPSYYLAKRELMLSHFTGGKTEASQGSGFARGYTSVPCMSCAPVSQNGRCSLPPLHLTTHRYLLISSPSAPSLFALILLSPEVSTQVTSSGKSF